MKSFSIIHIVLLLLAILVYQCAQAQDYVITLKGDSIAGSVKPMTFGVEKRVQVVSADKKKSVFSILQVREFAYKGDRYHPVRFENGYTFMKLVHGGYLSLYAFQPENAMSFDGLYLLKKDGTGMEVPNLTFKKNIAKFVADCPVSDKVKNGDYDKKHLEKIVSEYNECIDTRTVDHATVMVQKRTETRQLTGWDSLEQKVKEKPEFEGKADALEMIADVKGKITRGEKIPKFLLEGLKTELSAAGLSTEIESAIAELDNNN